MTVAIPMMTPAAIVDVLSGLIEAEQSSIFAFMDSGSPYLNRAAVDVRHKVEAIARANQGRVGELSALVDQLGGNLRTAPLSAETQYLAYLSMKYLVPKLVEAKRASIERCQNATRALRDAPDDIAQTLQRHLAQHQAELESLQATPKAG